VEGGRGEDREVIFVRTELLRLPQVWEGLGVEFGVVEHLFEFGVVEGAVNGGGDVSERWGGGRSGQWGGVRGGTGLGGGDALTSRREALWGGCRGRLVSTGCRGASCGGRGCQAM